MFKSHDGANRFIAEWLNNSRCPSLRFMDLDVNAAMIGLDVQRAIPERVGYRPWLQKV